MANPGWARAFRGRAAFGHDQVLEVIAALRNSGLFMQQCATSTCMTLRNVTDTNMFNPKE